MSDKPITPDERNRRVRKLIAAAKAQRKPMDRRESDRDEPAPAQVEPTSEMLEPLEWDWSEAKHEAMKAAKEFAESITHPPTDDDPDDQDTDDYTEELPK